MPEPQVNEFEQAEGRNQVPTHVIAVADIGGGFECLFLIREPVGQEAGDGELVVAADAGALGLQSTLEGGTCGGLGGEAAAASGGAAFGGRGHIDRVGPGTMPGTGVESGTTRAVLSPTAVAASATAVDASALGAARSHIAHLQRGTVALPCR